MSATIMEILIEVSDFVWGPYLLVPLLLLTGLFLTLLLRGLQFRKLWHSLWLALIVRKERGAEGDISHFEALMTALAGTVGTGNIVGVATAVAAGGPGALFWMWITALVGMATKYAEALLSVRFRTVDRRGEQSGGPMFYLSRGISRRWIGKPLGVLFALFAAVAAFGIGNMVQSNSVADALHQSFLVPEWASGVAIAGALAAVILGGIRSIGRFTGFFVPIMIVAYMLGTGVILLLHLDRIPGALGLVLRGAFSETAAAGGVLGFTVLQAMRFGVARGIFSNESGLGSAGIAAAAAQTCEPVRQALVSMTQTFIDTLVVCSFTGLAIIVTGAWESGLDGARMTQYAFREGLGVHWGGWVVALGLATFAFSTLIGWSYYGEKSCAYLMGERIIVPYRLLFVGAAFLGAVRSLDFVWNLSDVMCGLMALPNLVGLLMLSSVIAGETRRYFANQGHERPARM